VCRCYDVIDDVTIAHIMSFHLSERKLLPLLNVIHTLHNYALNFCTKNMYFFIIQSFLINFLLHHMFLIRCAVRYNDISGYIRGISVISASSSIEDYSLFDSVATTENPVQSAIFGRTLWTPFVGKLWLNTIYLKFFWNIYSKLWQIEWNLPILAWDSVQMI